MAEKEKVRVEDKLGVNKYHTDEHNSHIDVDKGYPDRQELLRLVRACPANVYKFDDKENFFFDYLGCLECGTCRALSAGKAIKSWHYPTGTLGVEYRYG